jgi:membrane protein YqaA with SNARE-associated domain
MSAPMLTPHPDSRAPSDLARVRRKNLIRRALSLLSIGVLAAIVVSQFAQELDSVTTYVFDEFGILGVTGALFITDSFISPLPPDSLLMLIANSAYHLNWPPLIAALGLVSCLAGYVGYGCGFLFSHTALMDSLFRTVRERSQDRILKYGSWAIVLGALTPIPFSITCWTAGLMHLPFRMVWWPCLLRVPRYMLYYAAIAYLPMLFIK